MHSPSSFSDSSSGSFFSTFFFFGFGGSIIGAEGDSFSCFISGLFATGVLGGFCSSLPAEVPGFLDLAFPFPAGFLDLLLFPVSGFLTMAADTACFEGCF